MRIHARSRNALWDGTLVALQADNSGPLVAAIEELLERAEPKVGRPAAETAPFDTLLKRCRTVAQQLQSFTGSLDAEQRLELVAAVAGIRAAAAGFGAMIWDRR